MKFLFRTLINQHHQLVYSQALHILGDPSEAEDASQEVYERLWKNIQQVDETMAKAWLLRVCKNHCIDRLRQREPTDSLAHEPAAPEHSSSPASSLANSQLSQWLQQLIAKLKEPQRSLVLLADVQQKSMKEIAKLMQMNENQVKVTLHRARKNLRKQLQGLDINSLEINGTEQ